MKELFSHSLRESLKLRYGKVPSAEVVARDFNLRAQDTSPVTQESVRRWIRGESLPKLDHLIVLAKWLHLDLNEIFGRISDSDFRCLSIHNQHEICDQLINNGSCKLFNEIKSKLNTKQPIKI